MGQYICRGSVSDVTGAVLIRPLASVISNILRFNSSTITQECILSNDSI